MVAGQGSAQIFSGLQAGALDAVWLVPPQSLTAATAGYPVIGTFKEVAPKFPFVCFATNDDWVKNNTARREGFRQGVACRRRLALRSRQPRRGREASGGGAQAFAGDRRREL